MSGEFCNSGIRENLRHDKAQSIVDSARSFWYRTSLHMPTEVGFFADQKATVLTDKESDTFEIRRGTKGGDPL